MATKKPEVRTYTVTGTINNLQIGVEVRAKSLEEAVELSKALKFSNFVDTGGSVHHFEGPEITAVWTD